MKSRDLRIVLRQPIPTCSRALETVLCRFAATRTIQQSTQSVEGFRPNRGGMQSGLSWNFRLLSPVQQFHGLAVDLLRFGVPTGGVQQAAEVAQKRGARNVYGRRVRGFLERREGLTIELLSFLSRPGLDED